MAAISERPCLLAIADVRAELGKKNARENLLGSHFESVNLYRLCCLICLARDLHRMTFVASRFIRICDGIELISCQQRELPRT
jgi:hypothetical protein